MSILIAPGRQLAESDATERPRFPTERSFRLFLGLLQQKADELLGFDIGASGTHSH